LTNKRVSRAAAGLAALIFFFCIAPEPQLIQITFLGDIMLGRGVNSAAARSKNWRPFETLSPITQWADVLAGNLESPLTIAPVVTSGYALCAPPNRVEVLKKASFDLVTLANNHIHDCGDIGIEQTRASLQSFGIQAVGPNPAYVIIKSHNRKLGFLALNDVSVGLDLKSIIPIIQSAARQSDLVIVSIHWGSEYQHEESMRQKVIAAALSRAGADIIIGHHPHVIQPMEMISRGSQKPPTLVFYSLGNALFDQHGLADTRTGEAVTLILGPGGAMQYSTKTFEIDPNNGVILKILE